MFLLVEFRYQLPSTNRLPTPPILIAKWTPGQTQHPRFVKLKMGGKLFFGAFTSVCPCYPRDHIGGVSWWNPLEQRSSTLQERRPHFVKLMVFLEIGWSMQPDHRNPQGMWMWMNLVKQWKETGLPVKMKHPFKNEEAMLHAHFCRSCTTAKGSYRKISTNRLKTSSSWFLLQRPSLSFPRAAFHTITQCVTKPI